MPKETKESGLKGMGPSWILWRGWLELEFEDGLGDGLGKRIVEIGGAAAGVVELGLYPFFWVVVEDQWLISYLHLVSLDRLASPPSSALSLSSIEILKTRQVSALRVIR